MTTRTPLLAIEKLTAHYGAAQALFGVDMTVYPGETVALVGANGAGKTTLLKCIMGLMPVSGGQMLLDGRAVPKSSPAKMVRQHVVIFLFGFPEVGTRNTGIEFDPVLRRNRFQELFSKSAGIEKSVEVGSEHPPVS